MMALGTIEEEAADCRAAWEGSDAQVAWHLHHDILAEALTESAERRIEHILQKPKAQQALRLRLFRPMAARLAEYERMTAPAWAECKRATAQAWAEYERMTDPAWAEYKRATAQAWAEFERVKAQARVEFERVKAQARVEFERVKAQARVEYKRVKAQAHVQECPDCPWDGQTIFPGGREAGR